MYSKDRYAFLKDAIFIWNHQKKCRKNLNVPPPLRNGLRTGLGLCITFVADVTKLGWARTSSILCVCKSCTLLAVRWFIIPPLDKTRTSVFISPNKHVSTSWATTKSTIAVCRNIEKFFIVQTNPKLVICGAGPIKFVSIKSKLTHFVKAMLYLGRSKPKS